MRKNLIPALLFFVVIFVIIGLIDPSFLSAETSISERQAVLQSQLNDLQKQIDAQQAILTEKQKESVSLERDVSILNAKIQSAQLNIKARDIAIAELTNQINGKQQTIVGLNAKIDAEKQSLASIIRQTNDIESRPLVISFLAGQSFSDFFADIDSFASIRSAMRDSFEAIRGNVDKTTNEKNDLENKQQEQIDLKTIQTLEKKKVEAQQAEKKKILAESKGQEAIYQKIIKAVQQSAAEIRAELFTLQGSAAIPFEKALSLANKVFDKTGVRQAFLLGIIAEESNLGANVGTGNWKVDMKAPRDTVPFLDITKRLGLNPDVMPVSKKPWYGYGGAMGPAQFIPSTWILYESRIASITGHNPPNPWDPEDAFTAAAIYLKDSGAAKRTVAAERTAALCYLAGCANAKKSAYQFYADDVMDLADKYQKQINILNNQ